MPRRSWRAALLCCLAASGCDAPRGREWEGRPIVHHFDEVLLRPGEILAAIERGDTLVIAPGNRRWVLRVAPVDLLSPTCTLHSPGDAAGSACPREAATYAGSVRNSSEWSEARLTLTRWGVRGLIRIGHESWVMFPAPDSGGTTPPAELTHHVFRLADLEGHRGYEGPVPESEAAGAPEHRGIGGLPETVRTQDSLATVGIAFAADSEYLANAAREHLTPLQALAGTLNLVDGVFRRENIATLRVAAVFIDPDNRHFRDSSPEPLLLGIRPALSTVNLDIHDPAVRAARGITLAFLASGKAYRDTLGLAPTPSLAAMGFQEASAPGPPGTVSGIDAQNFLVLAHEIGHALGAKHERADWFCRFWFGVCWNPAHDIMWPGYSFRVSPEFSNGSWQADHNNRQAMLDHLRTRAP